MSAIWHRILTEHVNEIRRLKTLLDTAFSGGARASDAPEDRMVFPLLVCCRDTMEEVLFSVHEGFGRAALRAVRTMYECVVVARFIHAHPEKAEEFLNTFHAQWAKIVQHLPTNEVSPTLDGILRARVPKYRSGQNVSLHDVEWSGKKTLEMAREAGPLADLHPLAFDLASAYVHPSAVLFMSIFGPGSGEDAVCVGESGHEQEAKFAVMLSYDLALNAAGLRLEYSPSDELRSLLAECKTDFARM